MVQLWQNAKKELSSVMVLEKFTLEAKGQKTYIKYAHRNVCIVTLAKGEKRDDVAKWFETAEGKKVLDTFVRKYNNSIKQARKTRKENRATAEE